MHVVYITCSYFAQARGTQVKNSWKRDDQNGHLTLTPYWQVLGLLLVFPTFMDSQSWLIGLIVIRNTHCHSADVIHISKSG